jgi:hypothetical protein
MSEMMQSSGMLWGMGFIWLLVVVELARGAAAMIKYLFSSPGR